jgi:hypothetical protein
VGFSSAQGCARLTLLCAKKLADFLTQYLPDFLRVSSQILHCTRQGFLRSRSVFIFQLINEFTAYQVNFAVFIGTGYLEQ